MVIQPKRAFICTFLLLTLFFKGTASAQESIKKDSTSYYKKQIHLLHDNDFLLFTDWYYTTGSFITYRLHLNDLEEGRDQRQLSFALSQLYYTPSTITSQTIEEFDRPYAGYTAITNRLTYTNERRILGFTFEIGVSGAISGAEGFQSWFHSTNESSNPEWIGQIDDATHGNLYADYTREWQFLPNPFSVHFAWKPSVAFGTRDIYLQNSTTFYFGKRAGLRHTMAHNQVGEIKPEFFFGINFTYRYVLHDALLEGNLLGDSSIFVLDPIDNLFFYGIEGNFRKKRMEYKLGYNYVSRRAATTQLHIWVMMSIARNF